MDFSNVSDDGDALQAIDNFSGRISSIFEEVVFKASDLFEGVGDEYEAEGWNEDLNLFEIDAYFLYVINALTEKHAPDTLWRLALPKVLKKLASFYAGGGQDWGTEAEVAEAITTRLEQYRHLETSLSDVRPFVELILHNSFGARPHIVRSSLQDSLTGDNLERWLDEISPQFKRVLGLSILALEGIATTNETQAESQGLSESKGEGEALAQQGASSTRGRGVIAGVGNAALGWLGCLVMLAIPALFIVGAEWAADTLLPWLFILSILVLVLNLFFVAPFALLRYTRGWAGHGFYISSYIFGITCWLLGFAVTLYTWGVYAVIVGLFILGVGVVPIGMLASTFTGQWFELGLLAATFALTISFRMLGLRLVQSGIRNAE